MCYIANMQKDTEAMCSSDVYLAIALLLIMLVRLKLIQLVYEHTSKCEVDGC